MYCVCEIFVSCVGIVDHAVEEHLVEFLVHEAGAFTLQLVRHAAGAVNHDAQVFRKILDGAANRLAQLEAAHARWAADTGSTFTHSGITLNGHSFGWPQVTDSGTVRP